MKTLLLLGALFLSALSFSQNVPDSIEKYCIIRTWEVTLSDFKVQITVDSGQTRKVGFFGGSEIMRDKETGKKATFISEVDALNFFAADGWKLINAFPVLENRDRYTKYLFKKTVPVN